MSQIIDQQAVLNEEIIIKISELVSISLEQKLEKRLLNLENTVKAISNNNAKPSSHPNRTLFRFAESVSSIIGLQELITARNSCLKFTWAIFLTLGIGATILLLYATANDYISDPTVTHVTLQSEPFYEYPPIVFCNEAWFDTEKAQNLGLSLDAFKYSLGYSKPINRQISLNVTKAKKEFYTVFYENNFTSLIDFYKAIATDMEPENSFDKFYSNTSLSHSYLAEDGYPKVRVVFLPLTGACFAFTLESVESALGVLYGPGTISIKFVDKTKDIIPLLRKWQMYFTVDFDALYAWPLYIEPSTNIALMINARRFIRMDKKSRPCISTDDGSTKTSNYSSSAANCFVGCWKRIYVEVIKCQLFWLKSENDYAMPEDVCNSFEFESKYFLSDEQWKIIAPKIKDMCFTKCLPKCDRILFEGTIQANEDNWSFNTEMIRNAVNANLSIATVIVMHDAMNQGGVLIFNEVRAYSFTELINNVGGTLGLFVGGTVMTMVQIFMFFVSYFCDKCVTITAL